MSVTTPKRPGAVKRNDTHRTSPPKHGAPSRLHRGTHHTATKTTGGGNTPPPKNYLHRSRPRPPRTRNHPSSRNRPRPFRPPNTPNPRRREQSRTARAVYSLLPVKQATPEPFSFSGPYTLTQPPTQSHRPAPKPPKQAKPPSRH